MNRYAPQKHQTSHICNVKNPLHGKFGCMITNVMWSMGPQVIVNAPITHKGGFSTKPPTVMLLLNKEFEVGGDRPSRKHPDSLESTPHGNAGRLVSLAPLVLPPLASGLACV